MLKKKNLSYILNHLIYLKLYVFISLALNALLTSSRVFKTYSKILKIFDLSQQSSKYALGNCFLIFLRFEKVHL